MTFIISSFIDKIPTRFNIGIMMFFATFTAYMLRTNISIAIIPMIKQNSTLMEKATIHEDPRFNWSAKHQSLILGGFFWGYLTTSLIGGILAERFGGRHVVGIALLASTILTALSPLIASENFLPIFICRITIGVCGGLIYPGLHCLVAKWSPPEEKGKFISALLGGLLGTVFTWMSLGIIIENYGWKYGFYIPAAISLLFTFLWYILVTDSPECHSTIQKRELEFIQNSLGSTVSNTKQFPPILRVLSSPPFLALLLLHYGSLWGLFFLMNAAPLFMVQALNFNLSKAGFLAALPPLARLLAGFVFGAIGDFIRRKKVCSVTTVRKSFCLFSHIIPGLFLLSITFVAFNKYCVVAVITLSLGFNGAATMTNLQNSQDLAPNFAGSLYGIINFVGTTSGFITPLIVAYFTQDNNTIYAWQHVFWVGAAVYILPTFIFFILGDGNVQKWNDSRKSVDTHL